MPRTRAAAHFRPTARFCSRRTHRGRCFACRGPVASQPPPHDSRLDKRSSRTVHPSRRGTLSLLRQRGSASTRSTAWLASTAPRRNDCSMRTARPSIPDRVTCCSRGNECCWRTRSMPRDWCSPVKTFPWRTTSPSIQGSASPRSPHQHPDRLRTARTASAERSSRGSIVLESGSRPLYTGSRSMANPSLSPDGSRIAFSRDVGGNWDVWVIDMQGAVSQVTSAPSLDFNPVWSSDSRQIFYQSNNANIYSRSTTDGTPEQAVLKERTMVFPVAVSPDGSVLLYTRATGPSVDLWYVSLGADRTPHPFVQTPHAAMPAAKDRWAAGVTPYARDGLLGPGLRAEGHRRPGRVPDHAAGRASTRSRPPPPSPASPRPRRGPSSGPTA